MYAGMSTSPTIRRDNIMMRGIILLKKRLTTKLVGGGCSLRIMLIIIHTKQASRAAYLLCMPLHVRVIKTKKKKKRAT